MNTSGTNTITSKGQVMGLISVETLQKKFWGWVDQAKQGETAEARAMAASLVIQWADEFRAVMLASDEVRIGQARNAFLEAQYQYAISLLDYAKARTSEDECIRETAPALLKEAQRRLQDMLNADFALEALEASIK